MAYSKESAISAIGLSVAALVFGTTYAIIKDLVSAVHPFLLMTIRFGLAAVFLSALFAARLRTITWKDVYRGSIIGLFLFLGFWALVVGIVYTTASKQAFLVGSYVLMVPLLVWLLYKKRPDAYSFAGAGLAAAGIGLLTLDGDLAINPGDLISILCAFFFACHIVAIEYYREDLDSVLSTIIQFLVTFLAFAALTGIFASFELEVSPYRMQLIGYLVLATTVITFLVQNMAQKHLSSTTTALILTLETAFGGIFAVLFLDEAMTAKMIWGSLLVLGGIAAAETKGKLVAGLKRREDAA
ncbi:MAG TPA: DMT family transporter [Selenomonadales bacterium]|nr:DMT family transporter [Selenomonadales bacterium]